MKMCPVLH